MESQVVGRKRLCDRHCAHYFQNLYLKNATLLEEYLIVDFKVHRMVYMLSKYHIIAHERNNIVAQSA